MKSLNFQSNFKYALWLTVMMSILMLQIRLLMVDLPTNKELFEECDFKVLCQKGMIDDPECEAYTHIHIPDSFNLTVGTTIYTPIPN